MSHLKSYPSYKQQKRIGSLLPQKGSWVCYLTPIHILWCPFKCISEEKKFRIFSKGPYKKIWKPVPTFVQKREFRNVFKEDLLEISYGVFCILWRFWLFDCDWIKKQQTNFSLMGLKNRFSKSSTAKCIQKFFFRC